MCIRDSQVIVLPPMETVYGHLEFVDTIAGGSANNIDAHGNITVEIQAIKMCIRDRNFTQVPQEELSLRGTGISIGFFSVPLR